MGSRLCCYIIFFLERRWKRPKKSQLNDHEASLDTTQYRWTPLKVFLNEKGKGDFIEKATMLYRVSFFPNKKKFEVLFFIQILGAQHTTPLPGK